MEHGAPSEILPVEVKLESPNVHLLDFGSLPATFEPLVFFERLLAQVWAGIFFYKIGFNEGTFRTLLCEFYY